MGGREVVIGRTIVSPPEVFCDKPNIRNYKIQFILQYFKGIAVKMFSIQQFEFIYE